jgi:hypothetical protein
VGYLIEMESLGHVSVTNVKVSILLSQFLTMTSHSSEILLSSELDDTTLRTSMISRTLSKYRYFLVRYL